MLLCAMHTCSRICSVLFVRIHVDAHAAHAQLSPQFVCMYMYAMYVCMLCMYVCYVWMDGCVYVHVYVCCMYVRMHVCTYAVCMYACLYSVCDAWTYVLMGAMSAPCVPHVSTSLCAGIVHHHTRIALCFSGSLRTFATNMYAYKQKLIKPLLAISGVQLHIFAHVWKDMVTRNSGRPERAWAGDARLAIRGTCSVHGFIMSS